MYKAKERNGKTVSNSNILLTMKERLKACLQVQSSSYKNGLMMNFIKGELTRLDVPFYMNHGNLYAAKGSLAPGESYPCVVSHTDTVHPIHKKYKIIENEGNFIALSGAKQVGTGGDDKAGIFICLELLQYLPVIKVAFFIDEEVGCKGSSKSDAMFFKNVGYVLQADRRGITDVTESINGVEMVSGDFKNKISNIMTKHSRSYVDGMMTDVEALSKKYNVSMFNCSCGYYEPHSNTEYVIINEVFHTLYFMYECITSLGLEAYPCEHKDTWLELYGNCSYDDNKYKRSGNKWDRILARYGKYYDDIDCYDTNADTPVIDVLADDVQPCINCLSQVEPLGIDAYCHVCGMYQSEIKELLQH